LPNTGAGDDCSVEPTLTTIRCMENKPLLKSLRLAADPDQLLEIACAFCGKYIVEDGEDPHLLVLLSQEALRSEDPEVPLQGWQFTSHYDCLRDAMKSYRLPQRQ
jgi:hypothetical protein